MNELELKESTHEHVIYFYRPEGRGTRGEIRMNIGEDKAVVVLRASEDHGAGVGYYAFKATKAVVEAVEECLEERNFPLKFIQAWY